MQNGRINPDEAIDRTLAALRAAAPPEGMEARIDLRIAERLRHPATPAEFGWRDLFAPTALARAWWLGALGGAAAALLLVSAAMLAQHGLRATPGHGHLAMGESAATRNASAAIVPVAASLKNAPSREALANPCASPNRPRVRSAAPASETLRAENAEDLAAIDAPSRPAPMMPLTEQERELIQLARTANPKVLASLNTETQARTDAADTAEFNKFFTPPPEPPQPAYSQPTTKANENQSQL